jgi:predicted nucleic acid-binding protein
VAKLRVLFDINVLIDVLQKREPFYQVSAQAMSLSENGIVEGFISAHSVTTLVYLITKDKSPETARMMLTSLLQFLKVSKEDQATIEQSLNLSFEEFEDAMQLIAAPQSNLDYVVTRNPRDFPLSSIPVLQPVDLIKKIKPV